MTYSARTRDGYRRALAAVTGLTTVGALTACGWLAGVAARDHGAQQDAQAAAKQKAERQALVQWQQQRAAWEAAHARPQVRTVWKKRPNLTVVDTRVVRAASVGTGGSLSSSGSGSSYSSSGGGSGGSVGSGGGGGGGGGGGRPPAAQSAPPPPPAPAPSSGS